MKKSTFILGGTSGLGQEIARIVAGEGDGYEVTVAGRSAKDCELVRMGRATPMQLDLEARHVRPTIPDDIGPFDLIVWAAGMQQRGAFSDLLTDEIRRHCRVQFEAPVEILAELLRAQKRADYPMHLVMISSTTSWHARADETLYGALKAAQSHLARGLGLALPAELPGSKVLLVNPGGMATPFWKHPDQDLSRFMDPASVASIVWDEIREQQGSFKAIQILRQPDGTPKLERGPRLPTF